MNPEFFAISIVILLFSVIAHEVMHGFVALKFGDRTALNAGRLTFNPIPHIDPIGTVLLPLMLIFLPALLGIRPGFLIGWAKPVPVNPLNFSDIKRGEIAVSLAGILTNFSLAIFSAILFHILGGNLFLAGVLQFSVAINLMLGVFNLLPIQPLDGSKVLQAILPLHLAREYERLTPYGFLIILALLYFDVLGLILSLVLNPLHQLLNVPPI